jgi:NAD(P)-dependent dehydrogenase (short-subunit alcohol dehydrogenase family)
VKLAGQVGIVTGAGRGIGTALAVALAREGMAVAVTSRNGPQLDEVVATIEAEGGRAIACVGDVADADDVQRMVRRTIDELGPIDLLVNNAGRGPERFCPLWEADMDDWWDVLRVNVLGPALGCHAVLPHMLARGAGRVVTIGSLTGANPHPTFTSYAVSKAAVMRLTDSLALSLAGTGVLVFELNPGLVHTPALDAHPSVFGHIAEEDFTPVAVPAAVVVRLAAGDLDAFHGRILDASEDDLDAMLSRVDEIVRGDARTLRVRSYGSDDPLNVEVLPRVAPAAPV